MKKNWIPSVLIASLVCGFTLPVQADTTHNPMDDHAFVSSDVINPTVGTAVTLHVNYVGTAATPPTLQVQTTLGTLNGTGSSITLTPNMDGTYTAPTLTSTVAGIATVSIYENGTMIGTNQVTFLTGSIAKITVQATPTTQVIGSPSTITINAVDAYGNPVSDGTLGSTFTLTTSQGQLSSVPGTTMISSGSSLMIATHNGVAQAILNDFTVGTTTVTVSDSTPLPGSVSFNGNTGSQSVSFPISYGLSQAVTATPINDFRDILGRPSLEVSSEHELGMVGVFHGDPNHNFNPTASIKRSEFAQVVSQYMALGGLSSTMSGTQTKFVDVPTNAWYDGAVAACASLGYVHGDGTHYYPENTISYAEVAEILLNTLGIQTTGSWPDGAIATAQQNGLFNGITSFTANQPATRGDVAIMVRNALHFVPDTLGFVPNTSGKTLETEMLGYTWNGDNDNLPSVVSAVPGVGTSAGNQLQVESNNQVTTLRMTTPVQISGASSLTDLMNKRIKYLTNPMGLVCYIEVVSQ